MTDEEVPEMPEDFGKEWKESPLWFHADEIPDDFDDVDEDALKEIADAEGAK